MASTGTDDGGAGGNLIAWDTLTLWRQLGRGSVGTTWLGEMAASPVVVKVLHTDAVTWGDDAIADFVSSISRYAALRHPHLVTVYGPAVDREGRRFGLVMEALHKSLYDMLADLSFPMPLSTQILFLRQIAAAVAYLHHPSYNQASIVHGDLRSHNIFVDAGEATCKVTDFGLVGLKRAVRRGRDASEYLTTGPLARVGGLLPWQAPELLADASAEPTLETDVYR